MLLTCCTLTKVKIEMVVACLVSEIGLAAATGHIKSLKILGVKFLIRENKCKISETFG